jgi:hypothetical protein
MEICSVKELINALNGSSLLQPSIFFLHAGLDLGADRIAIGKSLFWRESFGAKFVPAARAATR